MSFLCPYVLTLTIYIGLSLIAFIRARFKFVFNYILNVACIIADLYVWWFMCKCASCDRKERSRIEIHCEVNGPACPN